jgi:hypothetical protein
MTGDDRPLRGQLAAAGNEGRAAQVLDLENAWPAAQDAPSVLADGTAAHPVTPSPGRFISYAFAHAWPTDRNEELTSCVLLA